jgi:hypothetical protein
MPAPLLFLAAAAKAAAEYTLGEVIFATAAGGVTGGGLTYFFLEKIVGLHPEKTPITTANQVVIKSTEKIIKGISNQTNIENNASNALVEVKVSKDSMTHGVNHLVKIAMDCEMQHQHLMQHIHEIKILLSQSQDSEDKLKELKAFLEANQMSLVYMSLIEALVAQNKSLVSEIKACQKMIGFFNHRTQIMPSQQETFAQGVRQ